METTKVLIIGSGPAGYTAAIYASRANLQPILYEGIEPGGQLTTTTEIENFPGYPDGVDGNRMMADLRRQAERFGADLRTGTVTKIDLSSRPFHVIVDGTAELAAEAVIIATGASAKYLGLPSETKFRGQGVSACATCDGFFYRKKDVAVVGGGDTACEEATYLASLCRKVYMIVRKPFLRASKAMQQRVMQTPNIEVLFEHNTAEVLGDETGVTGALLRKTDGSERRIEISGFFLAIGHHPNTGAFRRPTGARRRRVYPHRTRNLENQRRRGLRRGRRAGSALPAGHHRRRIGLHRGARLRTIPAAIIPSISDSMKRIPILACTLCAACAMSSCAVETTYIGKTYPVTDNPELFFQLERRARKLRNDGAHHSHAPTLQRPRGGTKGHRKVRPRKGRRRRGLRRNQPHGFRSRPSRRPSISKRATTAAAPAPPRPSATSWLRTAEATFIKFRR